MSRVRNAEVNATMREFRRTNCPDTQRALAVALVHTRDELALVRAQLDAAQTYILEHLTVSTP